MRYYAMLDISTNVVIFVGENLSDVTFECNTCVLLSCQSSYPKLLVQHGLVVFPDGAEVCQLILACIIQVTFQLLQGQLCALM